jgi:hypothetical protein
MVPLSRHSVNSFLTAALGGNKVEMDEFLRDGYLHPAQEDEEQPPQPEPLLEAAPEDPLADRPMPNRDRSLSVFFEPHFSHTTSGFALNTSFSKSAPQALQ